MMVFDEKITWWHLLFQRTGAAMGRIWPRLLVTTGFALAATLLHDLGRLEGATLTVTPFSLIGLALGIFLGFRNNTSYERFWEGRKLWGSLVNTARSLTRQVLTLVAVSADAPESEREELRGFQRSLVHTLAGYVHALRMHLRNERDYVQLEPLLEDPTGAELEGSSNPPIAILHRFGEKLSGAWRRGWVHAYHLPVLEGSLEALTNIQGGCERIKSTPIPFSYTLVLHRIVGIYCLTLPLGIVQDVGWATPPVVLLVSYAFFALDAIGDEIEEPFGHDPNDLPLHALSTMIEVNLRERLGETELPALREPVDHILS